MTYFNVLLTFIVPPLVLLAIWVPGDAWRWLLRRGPRPNWLPYQIVLLHVLIALIYTTPWDNYLVATGVWWYDPQLVTGIRLGWVPIEEYTFFILQTLLTGLLTVWLLRRIPALPLKPGAKIQQVSSFVMLILFISSLALWLSGWQPGIYLSLILTWAALPVLLQASFGADILLANWRALAPAVILPTLYLWLVDGLAISSGTWSIDPRQTTGIKFGPLPIEEMLFFAATNLILVFGITLMCSSDSHNRAKHLLATLSAWRKQIGNQTDA